MLNDTHVIDSLPAYALGCLDETEAGLVTEHLAGCTVCRTELSAFQAVTEQLALAVPEASPDPDLKRQLMKRVQRTNPAPRREVSGRFPLRLSPAAGILGLLFIVALTVTGLLLWQQGRPTEVITGPQGMRAVALQNTDAAPGASGFIIISPDGQNGVIVVDRLPLLDAEREYQLWLIRDGYSASGAIFSVDESGYRGARISALESLLTYAAIRVTIEPAGGNTAPTGEEVLHGSLFNR